MLITFEYFMEDKGILEFVGRIYDAALLPERWDDVLDEFAMVLNVASSSIQVLDPLYSVHHLSAASSLFRDHPDFDELSKHYY